MQFANLKLARRIEMAEASIATQCVEAVQRRHPEIHAARISPAGGVASFTGVGSPITQAVGLGLKGRVSAREFDAMEAFYRQRRAAVNIEVCPFADKSLIELLGQRNYSPTEFTSVLVRPLKRNEHFPPPARGVKIRVLRKSEHELWAATVSKGFAEHFPVTQELLDLMSAFSRVPRTICFLGYVDGKLAGGALLGHWRGLATLGGASTLPDFRGRGLQTALQYMRLKVAAEKGCDLALTMTQPGSTSQRNAERRGFHVVYTRIKFLREWKTKKRTWRAA